MKTIDDLGRRLPAPLRRLVKRLLPTKLRARLSRVAPGSSRENVDIVVDDQRSARRWLFATPDTHRVRRTDSFDSPRTGDNGDEGPVVVGDRSVTEPAELLRPLSDPDIAASVVGGVSVPTEHGGTLGIGPAAMAVRTAAWRDVGGSPDGREPQVGLLERLRDAGHRIAVRPTRIGGEPARRTDPVDGAGSVVILGGVPLHDVGGGSRGAQLTLELLRHGYHVTYVARFDAAESVDLGLRFIHPRLEQRRWVDFDIDSLAARLTTAPTLALVELPVPEYLPMVDGLAAAGYRIVYDLLDRWSDVSLGSGWYRIEVERELARRADALIASAPSLVAHLEALSSRAVREVPNGVNTALFSQDPGPLPADFPAGTGRVLGYHGSLYGNWFDWEELAAVAESHPDVRVVVIGDAPPAHPPLPDNVWLLGLKAQADLPAYVSRFDVGLIPFRVTATTHAVSPLKTFEYLAMGVPVAAPPLEALIGLAGVYRADRLVAAVAQALEAPRPDRDAARLAHGWEERLTRIFGELGLEPAPISSPEPRVVARPARHYRAAERLL